MSQSFPPPPINPFERLQVTDGLLINADRWRRAHDYHRQRQNVHYQSLNQPGIVCDLGVRLIPAPAEVAAQYRDGRWVEVQPGLAIDLFGNIIVVPQPIEFRISTEPVTEEPVMVYLVVSYVDPERLQRQQGREMLQETFRIDEKTTPPGELEVELCRIWLTPDTVQLENPKDVFFPGYNCLDLRYRTQARSRPEAIVRVAQFKGSDSYNLSSLLQSLSALYPALQGAETVGEITLPSKEEARSDTQGWRGLEWGQNYDLLFLNSREIRLTADSFKAIEKYLNAGGVLLAEANPDDTAAIESAVALGEEVGTPVQELKRLSRNHPLRSQPFLFAALPAINKQPIRIGCGGGIVLVVGELSAAWGLDDRLFLPRETMRTAQELGINLLHFAWRRRQMTQLIAPDSGTAPLPKKQASSKTNRRENMFEALADDGAVKEKKSISE